MALRVWLPLNGNLDNLGCSGNINIINNGTTIDSNGKIGKCYSFGTNKYLKINDYATEFLTYNEFSLSVWFKCTAQNTAHGGSALISGGNWNQAANLLNLALGNFSSDHYSRLLVSGSGDWAKGYSYNFYLNQWYHVVLTSGNGAVRAYVNGELIGDTYAAFKPASLEQTWICIGNGTYTQVFHFNGLMNDIRIYDHCLSALEVKEISQGLVLHYKLDGFNGGMGDNILTGTYYNSYGSSLGISTATNATGKWCGGSGGNGTFSVVEDSSCPVGNLAWCINNNTSGNRDFQQGDQPYVSGQKYTTSFWAKGSGTCLYRSWNTTDGKAMFQKTWTLTSDWTYYTYTFTASAEMETDLCTFHLGVQGKSNISICGMKMEAGTTATPWSLSPKDIYKDSIKIIDSSGYGNHGTFIGNLLSPLGSSRYNASTQFLGSGNFIKNTPFYLESQDWTVSLWYYYPNSVTSTWESLLCLSKGDGSDANKKIALIFNNGGANHLWCKANSGNARTTPIKLNTWTHLVLTSEGKLYENGILKATFSPGDNLTGAHDLVIGARAASANIATTALEYDGKISDVRIYATVLSENDIKKLYQTPTEIDKKGSWHTHEFYEDDNNLISKNGLLHDSVSSEFPLTQHLKYDSNIYIEPDGSAWVHIYHYNNPGAGTFTYGSNMANSVYIDENRWFNATEICNQLNKWEFLVKYAYAAGETEHKQRWIQSKNPEVATFGDVDAADVTKITSDGYTTVAKFGGLYKLNTSDKAYWVMNNGTNGNWWGATGGFKIYSNGTPGYGEATAATVTTTGYNDLYVRIDNNIDLGQNEQAWITKNGIYLGNELIEK